MAKTVKVKMLKTAAGPAGNFQTGKKYTMEESQAKAFLKAEALVILGAESSGEKDSQNADDSGESGEDAKIEGKTGKRGRKPKGDDGENVSTEETGDAGAQE